MTVETDASAAFSLMKYVLHDINDAKVATMRTSSKKVNDSLVSTRIVYLIGDHHQVAVFDVKKEGMPLTRLVLLPLIPCKRAAIANSTKTILSGGRLFTF